MAQIPRINVIVPIPMDEAGIADRAEHLPERFVRAGFLPSADTGFRTPNWCDLRQGMPIAGSTPGKFLAHASGADVVT